MKEFFKNTLEIKIIACMFFTSQVVIYTLIAPFLGEESIHLSLVWQMIFISIILTLLQYVIYVSNILKKVNTWIKIIIHYILLVFIGYILARIFNWFDLSIGNNFTIALSIFTVCFVSFTGSIALYNKFSGERFNEKLRLYKSSKFDDK
ncbi:hypothetical protein [Clostridium sp. UBA1056]|uniref:hypothetical protein n=1 Tax=unclassified Clostridium TaxID=2614128 RepID=UPI003216BE46